MIIDGDYYNSPDNEGHIFFQLINLGRYDILLKKGDKIGQGIIKPYITVEGDRPGLGSERSGGFGSTDANFYPYDTISTTKDIYSNSYQVYTPEMFKSFLIDDILKE